MKRPVYKNIYK